MELKVYFKDISFVVLFDAVRVELRELLNRSPDLPFVTLFQCSIFFLSTYIVVINSNMPVNTNIPVNTIWLLDN